MNHVVSMQQVSGKRLNGLLCFMTVAFLTYISDCALVNSDNQLVYGSFTLALCVHLSLHSASGLGGDQEEARGK